MYLRVWSGSRSVPAAEWTTHGDSDSTNRRFTTSMHAGGLIVLIPAGLLVWS
jgi:hypothetical protein